MRNFELGPDLKNMFKRILWSLNFTRDFLKLEIIL